MVGHLDRLRIRHQLSGLKQQIKRLQAMADQKSNDPRFDAMAAAVAKNKVRELLK